MIRMSDMHFEIEMNLLGSSSKLLWIQILNTIQDIVTVTESKKSFIICKNFHAISSEILDIFQSYLNPIDNQIQLKFILLTEQVSFIPTNIVALFETIRFPLIYSQCEEMCSLQKYVESNIDDTNLVHHKVYEQYANSSMKINIEPYKDVIKENIYECITNFKVSDALDLRNHIYDIFIYNLNVYAMIWDIIKKIVLSIENIGYDQMDELCFFLNEVFFYYNTNYRPIFHLERVFLFLVQMVRSKKVKE